MQYVYENGCTYVLDDDGNKELMANFIANIIAETRYIDGIKNETILTIIGEKQNPDKEATEHIQLPPVEVTATDFPGMAWVTPSWGMQAVIRPGSGVKDNLRTAIQLSSQPTLKTVYKHLGWTEINKKIAFLHGSGAITETGNDPRIEVQMPHELSKYNLTHNSLPIEAIRASIALTAITKPEVTWPLLAATLSPLFGQVDFGTHVTGRTGTFKSELMSLFQSHYGAGMDARHLPGSWSSTANALEAQGFLTKNCAFCVDDFVPTGSAWQQRAYQSAADKLIRAQGNQAGRQRMTDTSNLQTAMYPRGIVMSTGEDTPEGHSVRARLMIFELSPGDITTQALTKAQADRAKYPGTVAALTQHIASQKGVSLKQYADQVRNQNLSVGHTRTPAMLGTLTATISYFLDWAELTKAITSKDKQKLQKSAFAAILAAGQDQQQYLEAQDPTDMFVNAVRAAIAGGTGHFRTLNGGIPRAATMLGWNEESGMDEMPLFKKRGQPIGWVDWSKDEMYIDIVGGFAIIMKAGGKEITLTKQTLLKRLKDAGKLKRTDDARQRNTIRVVAEGHARQVIALPLSTTLDTQEVPNE